MFVAKNSELRTYDSERGLELFTAGSGPDGYRYFRIAGPSGEIKFTVHMEAEPNAAAEQNPDQPKNMIVWVVHPTRGAFAQLGQAASDDIIRDALTAYKGSHGRPANQPVKVLFQ